jgi:uncharacterized membrane protein YeaQ/YmgE (transglycosylase-associated protein family)
MPKWKDLVEYRSQGYPNEDAQEIPMLGGLLWWCIVGLIAGWLAGKMMKGGGFGVLTDIVVGIVGAIIGGSIFGRLGGFPFGGVLVMAFASALIFLWLVRFVTSPQGSR